MKKESVIKIFVIILILSIFISAAYAEETENEKIKKAYDWLGSNARTSQMWNDMNVKQNAFSLLALGSNSTYAERGNRSLYNRSFLGAGTRCFGTGPGRTNSENDCRLTETALAKIALDDLEENTTLIKNWLISREILFKDIYWFLELDVARNSTANCTITYDDGNTSLRIDENKTLSSLVFDGESCFSLYPSAPQKSYWLRINQDCYNKSFKVNCVVSDGTEFKVSLKYKTDINSDVWHVSSQSNDVISNQEWEFEIQSYCMANPSSNICDYEGTAWAAYSLKNSEENEASKFVPYLIIKKDENKNLLPEALLYLISQKYGDDVEELQRQQGFWMAENTARGQFYDTALAGKTTLGDIERAKNYLITNINFKETQDKKYRYWKCSERDCEQIRDTAFLLWVFWHDLAPIETGNDCISQGAEYRCNASCTTGEIEMSAFTCSEGQVCCKFVGTGETGTEACESINGTCKSVCDDNEINTDVSCPNYQYCCKSKSLAETCSDISGERCESNQICNGENITIASGECCVGVCVDENAGDRTCSEIGISCAVDEVCVDTDSWLNLNFVSTRDSERCCPEGAECIQDTRCSEIGEECTASERCTGNTEETKDVEECCIGTCESLTQPETEKKGSLLWLWLALIVIILVLVVVYFLKFRKKKPKEEKEFFGMGSEMPRTRPSPSMPLGRIGLPRRPAMQPMRPTRTALPREEEKSESGGENEFERTLNKLKKMTKK